MERDSVGAARSDARLCTRRANRPETALTGFDVIIDGHFWVITEGSDVRWPPVLIFTLLHEE
jgi:hypothetical protein